MSATDTLEGTGTELIAIENVSKLFEGRGESVHALSGVALKIRAGEFVSLIGSSGCGKTTLLRMIADLIQPTEGSIKIAGQEPKKVRRNRDIGFVFQQPNLLDWRTVERNVQLPLEIAKAPKKERHDRVMEALRVVGLDHAAKRYPHELSGGMQQRVSIARALVSSPKVLLMDEPFGALDEITRDRLNGEIAQIAADRNLTVIFVTHSIREAVFLSDRIVVFSKGPGRITAVFEVGLPQPREPEVRMTPEFNELSVQGLRLLEEGEGSHL
jgi:NitT/TauT family transport system ATP-binding protein